MFIHIGAVRLPALKSTVYTTRRTKILYSRFPKLVHSTKVCAGQGHLSGSVGQLFVMMTYFTQQYSVHYIHISY